MEQTKRNDEASPVPGQGSKRPDGTYHQQPGDGRGGNPAPAPAPTKPSDRPRVEGPEDVDELDQRNRQAREGYTGGRSSSE